MTSPPSYRAQWLIEDLAGVLNSMQQARVLMAGGYRELADTRLFTAAQTLGRLIASPAVPDLADFVAEQHAEEKRIDEIAAGIPSSILASEPIPSRLSAAASQEMAADQSLIGGVEA